MVFITLFYNEYVVWGLLVILVLLIAFPIKTVLLDSQDQSITDEKRYLLLLRRVVKKIKYCDIKYVQIDLEQQKGYTAYAVLNSNEKYQIHFERTKDKLLEKLQPIGSLIKN